MSNNDSREVLDLFKRHFGRTPAHVAKAPGRLELLGNHTDYNNGLVMSLAVDNAADIEPAFAAAAREHIRGMVIVASPIYVSEREHIVRLAKQHRIATVFTQSSSVVAGGLASYGPDFVDSFARSAYYVDRILRGAKPADLPVEQADRFELAINRKTAAELGVTIPGSVLLQATEVIE